MSFKQYITNLLESNALDKQQYTKNLLNWHKDSHPLTKNADGSPKVFYHGTSADFSEFDMSKAKSASKAKPSDLGFWFTSSADYAENHGNSIMPIYTKIPNPKIYTKDNFASQINKTDFQQLRKDLIAQGYDGVVVKGGKEKFAGFEVENPDNIVVFEPNQIKSIHNKGTFNTGSSNILESITAYHGTPHNVYRFSAEKIGTGEGAQAFGYGLYFAGDKEVANYYAKALSSKEFANNKEYAMALEVGMSAREYDWLARKLNNGEHNTEKLTKDFFETFEEWKPSQKDSEAEIKQAITDIVKARPKGNLYKVELKPEEYELLDWDKPLSEQSDFVKSKLKEILKHPEYEDLLPKLHDSLQPFENTNGDGIYRALGSDLTHNKETQAQQASKLLHDFGIRGIKYLDNTSRGKGEGNHNYVIFNDKDVGSHTIVESIYKYTVLESDISKQQYTKNLLNWHKDSHPLTKNADGSPKVFYHGTPQNFSEFRNDNMAYVTSDPYYAGMYTAGGVKGAHYVSSKEAKFREYTKADGGNIMPLYVKANKIFDTRNTKDRSIFEKEYHEKWGNGTPLDKKTGLLDWIEAEDMKEFLDEKGYKYDAIALADAHGAEALAVFNPNQIKSIHNKGTFNPGSSNILESDVIMSKQQYTKLVSDINKYKTADDFANAMIKDDRVLQHASDNPNLTRFKDLIEENKANISKEGRYNELLNKDDLSEKETDELRKLNLEKLLYGKFKETKTGQRGSRGGNGIYLTSNIYSWRQIMKDQNIPLGKYTYDVFVTNSEKAKQYLQVAGNGVHLPETVISHNDGIILGKSGKVNIKEKLKNIWIENKSSNIIESDIVLDKDQYTKNLLNWHKDSHPLTKNADGKLIENNTKSYIHTSNEDDEIVIDSVFVYPTERGRGKAKELISQVINKAVDENKNVTLYVEVQHNTANNGTELSNEELVQFYTKLGFEPDMAMGGLPFMIRSKRQGKINKGTFNPNILESEDYQMLHKSPRPHGKNVGYDITDIWGNDIYDEPNAYVWYGHGSNKLLDKQTISLIKSLKDKPNKSITIYRAVPNSVTTINIGDWVTISKAYAKLHGDSYLSSDYKILEKNVKASDIYTDGNSIYEWGYYPNQINESKSIGRVSFKDWLKIKT